MSRARRQSGNKAAGAQGSAAAASSSMATSATATIAVPVTPEARVMANGPSSGPMPPGVVETVGGFAAEIGSLGFRRSGDYVSADFIPQLNGWAGAQTYYEIGENHPLLGGILFAMEMMIRRVQFHITPPDEMAEDEEAKAAAALARRMLFEELDRPWPEVLADIASMFQYGYAPLEITYQVVEEGPEAGELLVRSLDLRAQTSISRFDFEPRSSRVRGLWQQDTSRSDVVEVYIPRAKLAWYRTTPHSGNPTGRSLLRRAFTTYKRIQVIEEAEARAALRAAGFVLVKVPQQLLSPTASPQEKRQLAAIIAVAQNVAADRQSAVVLPSDVNPETKLPLYEISYVVADGQRSADMSPIIERGDARMAGSILADFMLLGQKAVGTQALSSDKSSLWTAALQGFVDLIAAETQRSVIQPWWRMRGGDPTRCPRMHGDEVQPKHIEEIADTAAALVASGVLTADDPLEAHIRKRMRLPAPDKQTARTRPTDATALATQQRLAQERGARKAGTQNAQRTREAAQEGATRGNAAARAKAGEKAGAARGANAAASRTRRDS
jgi:hypothetical protein